MRPTWPPSTCPGPRGTPTMRRLPLRSSFGCAQSDIHSQARLVVGKRKLGFMQPCDSLDQTESEAIARCTAARLEPKETLQHFVAKFRCNAGSVVGDAHLDHRTTAPRAQFNSRMRWRVAHRIFEQISEHLREQFAIALDAQRCVNLHHERLAFLLERRLINLRHGPQQLAEIQFGEAGYARAALDLCDAQQCTKRLQNRVDVVQCILQHRAGARRDPTAPLRQFQALAQACQRRAKIMRDVVGYLTQPSISVWMRSSMALRLAARWSN